MWTPCPQRLGTGPPFNGHATLKGSALHCWYLPENGASRWDIKAGSGLYSLPEAVGFYEQLGMTRLELEPDEILDDEDMTPYFEYIVFPAVDENDSDDNLF